MGAALVVALFSVPAHASMHWIPAAAKHGHGGHDRHAAKMYRLNSGDGASVVLINPKLRSMSLPVEGERVAVKAMGMDNYHALVATRSSDDLHESAVRYIYMFGKPAGESPSQLMAYEKSALEIEPAPYAREHWRYLSNSDVQFIVRYKGRVLADLDVQMSTANGTSRVLKTDSQGQLTLSLPDDFQTVKAGRMSNRPSEFVLRATHLDGAQTYTTTLSADYHVNPAHWQSTELGLAVVGGGMLLGALITWCGRRKEKI